ncbi:MAG TPA: hypothetical protein VMS31_05795 [Pyrinomonadaceae bacterium]|nr:hypothetical protein [Pyrinomonadaceae bacterium]
MKEDYLWDKTGEPDPEIQALEEVLGTLRYQPKPLEIPAGLAPHRKNTFLPRFLAIAATVAIMLLGAGLWFGLQETERPDVATSESKPANAEATPVVLSPESNSAPTPSTAQPSTAQDDKPNPQRFNPGPLSHQLAANRRPRVNPRQLTAAEHEEAAAAKEQLMLALRVASSKLNFAQKKAHEINTENLTRNQHKIG